MNREALLHIPESEFCFALDKNTVVIRLRTSKTDVF
ncbi:MAG: alpha amylase N-terminal ig-like domain-containing protein, partial [Clostridia bacterium]